MKNIVLAGFHAVGARLRMDPKSISAVYLDPERRDKRMREMRGRSMEWHGRDRDHDRYGDDDRGPRRWRDRGHDDDDRG